jgi:hypothetical protein
MVFIVFFPKPLLLAFGWTDYKNYFKIFAPFFIFWCTADRTYKTHKKCLNEKGSLKIFFPVVVSIKSLLCNNVRWPITRLESKFYWKGFEFYRKNARDVNTWNILRELKKYVQTLNIIYSQKNIWQNDIYGFIT